MLLNFVLHETMSITSWLTCTRYLELVPVPTLQIHFKREKVKYSIFAIVANFCSIADEMKHIQSLQLQ